LNAIRFWPSVLLVGFVFGAGAGQAQQVDPEIARQIAAIQAIDNHAHPVLAPPLDATDKNFDALPVDSLEAESDAIAVRPDFPLLAEAWQALWGFTTPPPLDEQGMKQLDEARHRVETQQGEGFPAWVLDQAGIATMLANRVSMGRGVQAPRFQWVPYIDALLFPLDNSGLAAASPDRKAFFALEDLVRSRYLKEGALSNLPPRLDDYLKQVVTATLERHKAGGAVAEKFEVAYLRSFDFGDPPRAAAERIYARWAGGGRPEAAEYKLLQDYLFRYIAMECGRLGMPVHVTAATSRLPASIRCCSSRYSMILGYARPILFFCMAGGLMCGKSARSCKSRTFIWISHLSRSLLPRIHRPNGCGSGSSWCLKRYCSARMATPTPMRLVGRSPHGLPAVMHVRPLALR